MLYLGIDVGSVSTNLIIMNQENEIIDQLYLKTRGAPIEAIKEGLRLLASYRDDDIWCRHNRKRKEFSRCDRRGDIVKNEITAHAV